MRLSPRLGLPLWDAEDRILRADANRFAGAEEKLLSGATASAYGLGAAATPDEVLSKLSTLVPMLDWTLLQEYKTAGAFTFTVPERVNQIGVYMIGGGGSGAFGGTRLYNGTFYNRTSANGGAAGYGKNIVLSVTPGQQISIVVGAGGGSIAAESWENSFAPRNGNPGGTTSLNGITVSGGEGGKVFEPTNYSNLRTFASSNGGQGTIDTRDNAKKTEQDEFVMYGSIPFIPVLNTVQNYNWQLLLGGYTQPAIDSQNKFDPFMTTLCAGGFIDSESGVTKVAKMPDGTSGGNGRGFVSDYGYLSARADDATGNGNGGGGIYHAIRSGQTHVTSISGAGSPGMVLIYKRRT